MLYVCVSLQPVTPRGGPSSTNEVPARPEMPMPPNWKKSYGRPTRSAWVPLWYHGSTTGCTAFKSAPRTLVFAHLAQCLYHPRTILFSHLKISVRLWLYSKVRQLLFYENSGFKCLRICSSHLIMFQVSDYVLHIVFCYCRCEVDYSSHCYMVSILFASMFTSLHLYSWRSPILFSSSDFLRSHFRQSPHLSCCLPLFLQLLVSLLHLSLKNDRISSWSRVKHTSSGA